MHCILCKMISPLFYIYIYISAVGVKKFCCVLCFRSWNSLYFQKQQPHLWMNACSSFSPPSVRPIWRWRERERCEDKEGWDVPWHIPGHALIPNPGKANLSASSWKYFIFWHQRQEKERLISIPIIGRSNYLDVERERERKRPDEHCWKTLSLPHTFSRRIYFVKRCIGRPLIGKRPHQWFEFFRLLAC